MGDLLSASGETADAVRHFEHAIGLLEQLLNQEGEGVEILIALEQSHFNLATCYERADRFGDAEGEFKQVRIDAGPPG